MSIYFAATATVWLEYAATQNLQNSSVMATRDALSNFS